MTKLKCVKITAILVMAMAAVLGAVFFSVTAQAQPGTPADPLVSRSYVTTRITELEAQIAQLTSQVIRAEQALLEATEQISSEGQVVPSYPVAPAVPTQTVARELFTVVRAEPGMVLIGGASAEIILRSGEATIVAGPNGLANVTAGHDIMNGQAAPMNHLLIVPQPDGRGLRFHTVAYLMVKGDFHWQF